jgi:hypothetical protein
VRPRQGPGNSSRAGAGMLQDWEIQGGPENSTRAGAGRLQYWEIPAGAGMGNSSRGRETPALGKIHQGPGKVGTG